MKNNPSAFSETSLGQGLTLSVNDTILQTAINVDEHRIARSQYSIGDPVGTAHVEFYIYSPNAATAADVIHATSSGHRVCVGIVDGQASFSKFVGEDAHGWGIEPDGYVWHNGAIVATLSSWTLNDYIGVTLDQGNQCVTFSKNGNQLGMVSLPSESAGVIPYYYAATVSGVPGDLAVWANAGQTPQRFPNPLVSGWLHLATGLSPLYLATEPYICASADSTPNQKYQGDIDASQNAVRINRGVKFWPWGASAPGQLQRGGQIQISIRDRRGNYSELMSLDIRDQIVNVSTVYQGAALSTATPVIEAVIDHCEQPTDFTKTLYCNDKLVLLQSQLVRPLFAPNADPAVASKPWPMSIGICRTYVPPFFQNLTMAAGDEFISAVGKWRMGGKEWGYTIDYTVEADGKSFTAAVSPTAKVTAETTTFGGTFTETDPDLLSGGGVFGSASVGSNGQAAGWTGVGGYLGHDAPNTIFQLQGVAPNKVIHQDQKADAIYRYKRTGLNIAAGQSIAYEVVVKQAPYYGPGVDMQNEPIDIPPAYLAFGGTDSDQFQFFLWKKFQIPEPQHYAGGSVPDPVTYRGTFTNTHSTAQPLIFAELCNNMIQGTGNITSYLEVESIRIVELPALLQNEILDGPGLDVMLQDLFINHGPLVDSDYDATGATDIDDRTGYKLGLHVSENDTPQVMDCARPVLDSFTADCYVNRSGKVSTVRLFAPEDVSTGEISGTLTANDFQGYLQPFPDNAENLTTRMSGCRNYDPYSEADFANVTLDDVPQIVRKKLEQAYQWTVTANAVLSTKYQYALSAAPFGTQLDRIEDGQAEITRVCKLYEDPRWFYVGTVFAKAGRTFELGQTWTIEYEFEGGDGSFNEPIPNLSGGGNVVLVGIQEGTSDGLITLVFWGL